MTAARCTGHCCRTFVLPYAPAELAERQTTIEDGEQIAAMVIYLGTERPKDWPPALADARNYYTCRNFDEATRDCKVYAERPRMCRDYPYGSQCKYEGCTYEEEELVDEQEDPAGAVAATPGDANGAAPPPSQA